MRQFAITDIHGCNTSFVALLDQIGLTTADELYLLGDYVDRGPDSKGVLDTILQMRINGHHVRCLSGNHEYGMLAARHDWRFRENWIGWWGGRETLESFGVWGLDEIAEPYWDFLTSLELYIEIPGFVMVHAGLDWTKGHDPLANEEELFFARNWYHRINYDWLGDRTILHGHTPIVRRELEHQFYRLEKARYLDLDNGCVYDRTGDGDNHLCAFDMTNRALFFQKNLDDVSRFWERR